MAETGCLVTLALRLQVQETGLPLNRPLVWNTCECPRPRACDRKGLGTTLVPHCRSAELSFGYGEILFFASLTFCLTWDFFSSAYHLMKIWGSLIFFFPIQISCVEARLLKQYIFPN